MDVDAAGDTYTYDPPESDETVVPMLRDARVHHSDVASRIIVQADLDVPAGLTADRRARSTDRTVLSMTITATLWAGVPELDWTVELDNEVSVATAAARRRTPLRAYQLRPGHGAPGPVTGPRVEGALVSAHKPAEDGDGAVLRLVNPTSTEVLVEVPRAPYRS